MTWYRPTTLLDKIFEGGIVLKGLSGLAELIGGILLLFIGPKEMHHFIVFVTQRELVEDPNDKIANVLLMATQHFGQGSRQFLIVYLWIHAAVKLIAVIGILRNKLWAYPFSLISLGILTLYQLYTIFIHASLGMILLTIFDVFILCLIWREYGKVKPKPQDSKPSPTQI